MNLIGTVLSTAILVGPPGGSCNNGAQTCTDSKDGQVIRASFSPPAGASDIVDTAVAAGSFKTLAAALQAAGLVDTLKGSGPFTVFAPTDAAFAKLPAGTVESLLKPENKEKLTAILTYHVVSGAVKAKDVTGLTFATSLQGQRIDVVAKDGTVKIDGATVTKTDIECSNGVIHVIDTVIMPASEEAATTATDTTQTAAPEQMPQTGGSTNTLMTLLIVGLILAGLAGSTMLNRKRMA